MEDDLCTCWSTRRHAHQGSSTGRSLFLTTSLSRCLTVAGTGRLPGMPSSPHVEPSIHPKSGVAPDQDNPGHPPERSSRASGSV